MDYPVLKRKNCGRLCYGTNKKDVSAILIGVSSRFDVFTSKKVNMAHRLLINILNLDVQEDWLYWVLYGDGEVIFRNETTAEAKRTTLIFLQNQVLTKKQKNIN